VLQRALRPLRPELKHVEYTNTYTTLTIDSSINVADANTISTVASSLPGRGEWVQADLGRPTLLTLVAKGTNEYERIGREIQVRRIEIRAKFKTTASQTITPTTVRLMVIRTGALPQSAVGWAGSVGTGSSYPSIAQAASSTNPPCTWLYDTDEPNAFPAFARVPRAKALARPASIWKRTFSPNLMSVVNPPGTNPYSQPGLSQRYMRIVIKPRGKTVFEDLDNSFLSGYAAQGHYWLQAVTDSGNLQCDAGNFVVRVWYTDA